jgi:predicted ATP-grasp superfamily ATP-dependent carboligase
MTSIRQRRSPSRMRAVLVTDGEQRSALAACRGLAAAGYEVSASAHSRRAPAHWSRACHRRLALPDPRESRAAFVTALERELESHPYDVLLPGSDAVLRVVSDHRERLERVVRIGLPLPEQVEAALDKIRLFHEATSVGLAPLPTVVCESVDEARAALQEVDLPAIFKPQSSVRAWNGALKTTACIVVHEPAPALGVLEPMSNGAFLVQRYVTDALVLSYAGVMAEGRLLALTAARYHRTWPPPAGSVASGETMIPDRRLLERLVALLRSIGWQGIFEAELVVNAAGEATLSDLNPRIYGSLGLSIAAGANLPAIWCDWVLGRETEYTVARPGVRYRWEDAELRHALWQLRHGRVQAAACALRPSRATIWAHLRRDDSLPLLARGLFLTERALARVSTSTRSKYALVRTHWCVRTGATTMSTPSRPTPSVALSSAFTLAARWVLAYALALPLYVGVTVARTLRNWRLPTY